MAAAQSLAITVRRSLVGLGLILIVGAVLVSALGLSGFYLAHDASQRSLAELLFTAAGVTVLATIFQAYVYSLSYLMYDSQTLTIVTWRGILSGNNNECEFNQVQNVSVKKRGVLSLIFDYGTLVVETAGTRPNLTISYVPNAEHWADAVRMLAETATQPVHNQ